MSFFTLNRKNKPVPNEENEQPKNRSAMFTFFFSKEEYSHGTIVAAVATMVDTLQCKGFLTSTEAIFADKTCVDQWCVTLTDIYDPDVKPKTIKTAFQELLVDAKN